MSTQSLIFRSRRPSLHSIENCQCHCCSVLAIRGSLVADFRRDRCIDGAGAGSFHFIRTRRSTVGTAQIAPPLPRNNAAPRGRHFCLALSKFWSCVGSGFSQRRGKSDCREQTYSCLYTVPFFITKRTSSITLMSLSGLPGTAMRSARLPTAITPRSSTPSKSAA